MKNFVTVIALMVSMTGIFVSLAREELRCKLGLSGDACRSSTEKFQESPKTSVNHSDFIKPASEVLHNKPESVEQGSLQKSSPQPVSSPDINKIIPASTPEINANKILKPDTENPDKSIIPATEPVTSSLENSSPGSPKPELPYPAHENSQMINDDSAASANNSPPAKRDNINSNQPIPVIPPPQTNQP